MKTNILSPLPVFLLAVSALGLSPSARAGDVTNAQLVCYVDAQGFIEPTAGECRAASSATVSMNYSNAFFFVTGLPAGSYSFYWSDLTTGQTGVCSSSISTCIRAMRVGRVKHLAVTVVDNQTGQNKTVDAYAYYEYASE